MHKSRELLILVFILLFMIVVGCSSKSKFKDEIIFKDMKYEVEYGNVTFDPKSFVEKYGDTAITIKGFNVNKVGEQKVQYTFKLNDEIVETKEIKITVKDTKKPIIKIRKESMHIAYGSSYDLLTNIENVSDEVDGNLVYKDSLEAGSFTLISKIDVNVAGTYTVEIQAQDINKNITKKKFKVIVDEKGAKTNEQNNQESNPTAFTGIQPTYINGILLVNKTHPIPKNFGGYDDEAYQALCALQALANSDGHEMPLISGYRSYDYQAELYNSYVARDGQEAADRYSARPGTSEHQTGLAFDVGELNNDFGETPAGKWLRDHCAQFGFILRYTKDGEPITGYMYEPWHIRYVGKDVAKEIMSNDITLEEYLGAD